MNSCRSYHAPMNRLERTVEGAHAAALGVWLAVLVAAGLAAAIVFPEMKELDPRLPGYASYTGDHWMIAAGHVGRRAFAIADRAQLYAAAAAVLTLAVVTRLRLSKGPWLALRWVAVGVASGLAIYNGLILAPKMDDELVAYWAAAREGDQVKAAEFRAVFSAQHPQASRVLVTGAAGVFVAIVAAAASRNRSAPSRTGP